MAQQTVEELAGEAFIREQLQDQRTSSAAKYQALVTGRTGWRHLLAYELRTSLFGQIPGALGLLLRRRLYRRLFAEVGSGLVVGRNVTLRHADNMRLGDGVILDDDCLIDARGAGADGLVLEKGVIVNRGAILKSKSGPIRIGPNTAIGSGATLIAMGGLEIGHSVMIAGGSEISGGMYHTGRTDVPIARQGIYTRGPISIGSGSWLGMGAIVLDGVRIGEGCVIGAGAVVTDDLPDRAVAVGVPARVLRIRGEFASPDDKGHTA